MAEEDIRRVAATTNVRFVMGNFNYGHCMNVNSITTTSNRQDEDKKHKQKIKTDKLSLLPNDSVEFPSDKRSNEQMNWIGHSSKK